MPMDLNGACDRAAQQAENQGEWVLKVRKEPALNMPVNPSLSPNPYIRDHAKAALQENLCVTFEYTRKGVHVPDQRSVTQTQLNNPAVQGVLRDCGISPELIESAKKKFSDAAAVPQEPIIVFSPAVPVLVHSQPPATQYTEYFERQLGMGGGR